jgi:ubiquinol-cytochrome c reductase cytochrome b subunit
MFSAILIILILPITDLSRNRGIQFRPLSKIAFYLFVANFLILMQLGAKHVESPFIEFGQISTILYFAYFVVIVPFVTFIENTLIELHYNDYNPKRILVIITNKKLRFFSFILIDLLVLLFVLLFKKNIYYIINYLSLNFTINNIFIDTLFTIIITFIIYYFYELLKIIITKRSFSNTMLLIIIKSLIITLIVHYVNSIE